MRNLSIAVLACVIAMLVALTGCGGGGGGGGDKGGGGVIPGNTIVIGTVQDNQVPPQKVGNVAVSMGFMSTVTDGSGKFVFNLGSGASVMSLFADPSQAYFKVSTRLLPQDQYPQVNVAYRSVGYEQIAEAGGASIPVPLEVYVAAGTTADLGTVIVQFNNPINPPPIPF